MTRLAVLLVYRCRSAFQVDAMPDTIGTETGACYPGPATAGTYRSSRRTVVELECGKRPAGCRCTCLRVDPGGRAGAAIFKRAETSVTASQAVDWRTRAPLHWPAGETCVERSTQAEALVPLQTGM